MLWILFNHIFCNSEDILDIFCYSLLGRFQEFGYNNTSGNICNNFEKPLNMVIIAKIMTFDRVKPWA